MRAALAAAPNAVRRVIWRSSASATTARRPVRWRSRSAPDVVVAELHLGDRNGIALARQLGRTAPAVRVLILASHGPEAIVHQAFGAGVGGYALKGQPPAEVIAAIRRVGLGELVLPPGVVAPPPRAVGARVDKNGGTHVIERLSQRERQIFDLVIWGSSNKQIAGRLGISIKTVETHRGHINGKLRVHTSADIVRLASLWGMLLGGAESGPAPAPTERCRSSCASLVAAAADATSHLFGQRLAGDAEVLGGERAVAAADLQHAADVAELHLLERRDARRPIRRRPRATAGAASAAASSSAGRCAGRSAVSSWRSVARAITGAQLAHVAGPAVAFEQAGGLRRDLLEAAAELARPTRRGSARPAPARRRSARAAAAGAR